MIQLYYHTWSKSLPQLQPLSYITSGYCTITCSCCYKSCLWTHFVCICRSMQEEKMPDVMDYVVEILIKVLKMLVVVEWLYSGEERFSYIWSVQRCVLVNEMLVIGIVNKASIYVDTPYFISNVMKSHHNNVAIKYKYR